MNPLGNAPSLAERAGLWGGLRLAAGPGIMTALPFAAFDAAHQRKGERLPTLAGRTMAIATFPATSAAFASGLMLIPGIGPAAACALAPLAALYPNALFQNSLARGFRKLSHYAQDVRRLEMGGNFQDSLSAKASRMAAINEMNGTMVASRRFLGQEAEIYHR